MNKLEAIFIDRDGTIGGDNKIQYPGQFKLFEFTEKAFSIIKKHNIKIFSFTNQPGIAKGLSTEEIFKEELIKFGFDHIYICPHSDIDNCICRKPKPGMLLKAKHQHSLNLENCVVIGDNWSDMQAAAQVNAKKLLVKTGEYKEKPLLNHNDKLSISVDYIAENLLDAVEWLLFK